MDQTCAQNIRMGGVKVNIWTSKRRTLENKKNKEIQDFYSGKLL